MRLLEFSNIGELSLTKDLLDDNIPPYAILSHTWGPDTQEVTFKDLMDDTDTGKCKAGYNKIRFCAEQARRDGLQYFWVDTCCIDKSNNNELSEAINSMFRWYRDSARCYVYLFDVSVGDCNQNDHLFQSLWEADFRASRWFTRGWTLQELIAPAIVEFFSQDRIQIGDKKSLAKQIHEITGIAISALQGTPLSQFSVNERFKWAQNRETTRKEDWVYSLLGIFNVFMPLIYGEGRENALKRLQEEIHKSSAGIQQFQSATEQSLSTRLDILNQYIENSLHERQCNLSTILNLIQENRDELLSFQQDLLQNPQEISRLYSRYSNHRVIPEIQRHERNRFCNCHPEIRTVVQRPLAFIRTKTETEVHAESCRVKLLDSERTVHQIQVTFPFWLLNRTIEINFGSKNASGGHFLSHFTFKIRPNILWYNSVAFVSIHQFWTCKLAQRWSEQETEYHFQELLHLLDDHFVSKKASVLDVDASEGSLLHFAVIAFLQTSGGNALKFDFCRRLIAFLNAWGVPKEFVTDDGSTALNESMGHLHLQKDDPGLLSIRRQLQDIGVPLHALEPTLSNIHGLELMYIMRDVPEILEEWKCGPNSAAVLSKNEAKLRRLLQSGHNPDERTIQNQTAIHLSIQWPTGIRLLIQHGANINILDEYGYLPIYYAVERRCLEAVKLLLRQNCWMTIPPCQFGEASMNPLAYYEPAGELFKLALNSSTEIREIIFRDLVDKRIRLRALAILNGWRDEDCMDGSETSDLDACGKSAVGFLAQTGNYIPPDLYFVGPATVYHRRFGGFSRFPTITSDHSVSIEIAEQFYELGFKDFDEYDSFGFTPLMEYCSIGDFKMSLWLLEKGASANCTTSHGVSILQIFMDRLARQWLSVKSDFGLRQDAIQVLRLLLERGNSIDSSCNCFCACSPEGSNPIKAFLRRGDVARFLPSTEQETIEKIHFLSEIINTVYLDNEVRVEMVERIYRNAAELHFFECHATLHTCCHFSESGVSLEIESRPNLDDLVVHIQEEMQKYDNLRKQSKGEEDVEATFRRWKIICDHSLDLDVYESQYNASVRGVIFKSHMERHTTFRLIGNLARNTAHMNISVPLPNMMSPTSKPPEVSLPGKSFWRLKSGDGSTLSFEQTNMLVLISSC